jgi:hypothetical protein
MKTTILATALLVTIATAHAADPGTASGKITIEGKSTELKYAMSRATKNPFHDDQQDVEILISNIPVSAADFDTFKLMKLVDTAQLTAVSVEINPEKSVISGSMYSPAFNKYGGHFSATGMHELETTTFAGTDVAGKLYMAKPDTFDKIHFVYSVDFHAVPGKLPEPSKTAKALPAGGGDAGDAYRSYMKVLTAGNIPELKKRLTASRATQLDSPEIKKLLPMIQAMQPTNIKVTGGSIDGNTATLKATGMSDGAKNDGTITMVKENGAWKVEKESWEQH